MVRVSKVEKSVATAPVPVPVVATPEVVLQEKKEKKARKPKTPAPVVEEAIPANEVVVVASPVSETPTSDLPTLQSRLSEFGAKLQQITGLLSSTKSDYKLLEKLIAKNEKLALKNSHKKRKASGNRAPSGFNKPSLITDELATFLGKSQGTMLARTEVSKEINRYIREHGLQDKANGRRIIADNKLTSLLKLKDGEELTYFNLQKFMKHHYIKNTVVA